MNLQKKISLDLLATVPAFIVLFVTLYCQYYELLTWHPLLLVVCNLVSAIVIAVSILTVGFVPILSIVCLLCSPIRIFRTIIGFEWKEFVDHKDLDHYCHPYDILILVGIVAVVYCIYLPFN